MSRKDIFHDIVKQALQADGWEITHDPLIVPAGRRKVNIDLGGERLLGARKKSKKIAIEVKSFLNLSYLYDFYGALGQFRFYLHALEKEEPDRELYLAVSTDVFEEFFEETFIREVIELESLKIITFSVEHKKIIKWIK